MSADPDTLIALWAGQPEADLRADIAEIITRVGADNPSALADEIAYVVMQHGVPVAAIERIQTVRMLVDGQAKGSTLTGDRDQFTHGWHVIEGIDLAMQAIHSPHMRTVEELNHG